MKRKKSKKELFSELHRNGKTTNWIKNNNVSISMKFSSKVIAFILVFMLLFAYTKADEIECPAGYSCENDLKTPCEVGWYSLKGETTCSRCKPGTICPTTTDPPIKCKDGEYSQWSYTKCELCPPGYMCKLYNGQTQFIRCPMGQYTKEGGTECLPTPPGYMSASPAQEPMPCFDGYFTTATNSTYCSLCPRGYQCKQKDKEPEICPEGTYSGQGAIECIKCPDNMFCPEGSSYPRECPIDNPNCWNDNHLLQTETDFERRNLQSCSSGTYWDGYNCLACPEGFTCAGGSSTPSRCGTDQYSAASATSCTSCGSGYICPTPRASDRYQCQAGFVKQGTLYCRPCAEGKYCPDGINENSCASSTSNRKYSPGGLSACLNCPASTECNDYTYIDCTEGFYYESSTQLCTACPVGNYCQNNVMTACSAGEYQPFMGFTFCFQCPVMTKCPTSGLSAYTDCASNSEWSAPGSTSCTSCELNYECFVGYSVPCKSNYYSAVGSFECKKCPEGYSCNTSNPTIQSACSAGQYSPAGSMNCYTCPAGSMCPNTKMSKPIPCSPGKYQSSTGQTACISCSNGYYSNVPGSVTCNSIPSGHYSLSLHGAAIPCPKGTYPTADGTGCQACTAGYLCGIGESSAAPSYALCPVGYYCPVVSGAVVLTPCSAGKYGTSEGAATEAAGCTDCSAGFYCPGGTALPISCPEGAYCAAIASTPTLCGPGKYNKFKGKSSSTDCVSCVGGQLCPAGSTFPIDCPSGSFCSIGATSASQCNAGTYMPMNNLPTNGVALSSDCVTCPKGNYCLAGSSNPTPCPVGTYRDTTGGSTLASCSSCPAGKACPFQGITDQYAALDCAYGHYCPLGTQYPHDNPCLAGKFSDSISNTQSSDCVNCAAGYGCTAGANTYTNPPVICAAGYYCPAGSSSSTQNQCPAGYYSSNTGLSASSQCLNCPAGKYCVAGSVSPTGLCSAGYWCPINSGVATQNACAVGTYSASTGLKTSSECTVCPLGYICASTAMTAPVMCAAGTYGSMAGLTGLTGSTCTTCPAGYYCTQGATSPTACGKGKYSNSGAADTGANVCTKCPAGSYCAKDATANTDVTACAAGFICNIVSGTVGVAEVPYHPTYSCPAGQYCAQGVAAGTLCPLGTYNPSVGKTVLADCLQVPAGYYADTTGTSDLSSNACPAGYYCLAGATSRTTNPCPAGTYRNLVGAVQLSDCATCPTGYYCGKNTVSPVKCPQGYYCTNGVSEGTKCPAGYYGADSGLSAATDCTICPQGRYCSQSGLSAPDGLCDPGFYCGSGTTSPAPPTRRLTASAGVCPAGGYCEQGSKYPTRCPPGTFSTVAGISLSSQCLTCTDGNYCIGTIDPSTSGLCTAGYYCNLGSTIPTQHVAQPGYYAPAGSANQIACAIGYYNPYYAQAACIQCKKGYYCPSTQMSVMTDCPVGKFCVAGSSTFADCAAGTYNDRVKATAQSDCKACPPGQYCTGGSSASNGNCNAGYYCRASSTSATPSGSATNFGVCPAGYYCPAGTGDPIQCPPGTFNPNTQSTSSTACQTCTAGSYCSQPNLSAVEGQCPVGYHCPAGTNVKYPTTFCAAGYKCPAGSTTTTQCIAGTYQNAPRQGICRVCPAGYTCAAGATAFAASPCSAGKYCPVGSSTETSCIAGTYNPYQKKTSSSDCISCDPGSYCATAGLTAVTGQCTAGYFCTLGSTTATPTSGAGGQCQPGYYCPAGATVALPCPPKQYCSTVGLSAPQGNCLAGYYCSGLASRNNPTILATHGGAICPAGYYCPAGTSSPNPCPPGTYRSSTSGQASTDCQACDAGKYCSSFGGTATTGSCQAGYYCPAGSSVANSVICPAGSKCPAGAGSATACSDPQYQDEKGQSTCKTCQAGYTCTATSRTLCRPDKSTLSFYCPGSPYASVSCSTGTITNVIGATSQSDCVSCPPGYYCPNSASLSKTVQCPAGYFCSGGASQGDGTGSNAGVCPIGSYCPAGTNLPRLCTPGKYCATTGLQIPTGDCTAGYYCLEGSSTATPSSGSMGGPCPAGSYCPAGSSIYIQCPVGTFNPSTSSTSSAACQTCTAGKKCLSRGLSAPSTDCPAGYYCTQNPYTLKSCEQGYYCPAGSDSQIKCPSGQYQPYTLQSSCITCPAGYYCPQVDTTRKIICTSGSFCISGQAAPTVCPLGTYNPREGVQSQSDCEQCPNGKYCGSTGLTSTGTDCTSGYYCTRGSSTATQNACPIGYYCPAGTTAPVPCPAGTYNDIAGKGLLTDCRNCPAGKFCPDPAMTAAPTTATYNCAAGFICLGGSKTKYPLDGITGRLCNKGYYCTAGATADTLCQDGTYNPYSGMIACINCPKGYYCDSSRDTTTKIACPAGSYCPAGTPGTINKSPCPAGTYSANTKLSASTDCIPCDPGKYCLVGSTAVTGNCDAGYVCPRGASVSNPTNSFSFVYGDTYFNKPARCPQGHRCPAGSYYPIPCTDGTYQDTETQSVCKSCPAGYYCDKNAITASEISTRLCAAGHFCSGGTKVLKPIKTTHSGSICSSGKYCPAGTATELSCLGGYYDKRKGSPQCMQCPAGYYCPAGSTEPTVCPATMYCVAGVAAGTYCPNGSYNTADGLESTAECRPCPVSKYCQNGQIQGSCDSGYFCDSGANASNDISKKCPKNHYCEAGTAAPVRCEAGKVNPSFFGTSPSNCVTCTAGKYCPETGDGTEIACPAGFYCVAGVTQPTACPVGTYVGTTGAIALSSCTTCGAGYLCNVEGVGALSDFSCPVGYYCTAGSKNPTKCPAGTFRNTVGAGAASDCGQCPGGFYCPEGTINPIICPAATYCPAGSSKTTSCTSRYYCPPQTASPINCPQAYYCPTGVETYIKCANGTYCPTNSESPTLCPGGTFGNGNPNNYNSAVSCVQCDAGTYSTTAMPGYCLPCTAGYVCLGNTITSTPVTKASDNGYECPVGYYCPTGSSKEIPCPAGTYTDSKRTGTLSACKSCPANSYNDQTGQKGCKTCGGTASSAIGAKSCTCKGIGREYIPGNGECLCAKGYSKADKTTDINSDQNCELSTTVTCSTGYVANLNGTACMSESDYCKLECTGQGSGTGTYISSLKKCQCDQLGDYDAGCSANSCTSNKIVKYGTDGKVTIYQSDGTTQVGTSYDPSSVSGVYGTFTCTRTDGSCTSTRIGLSGSQFVYDFKQSAVATRILRELGIEEEEKPIRRDLATVTSITNPTTCVVAGNMVEFSVDSTTKSYPVYMSNSLLNTNPSFDYSGFINLKTTVEGGTATVSVYVFTFTTAGTYVFMNSLNNYQQTIIKVVAADASCSSSSTVSATTLAALYSLNLSTTTATDSVSMIFFIQLVVTKIGLLVFLVAFITYMHSMNKEWTLCPCLRRKKEEDEEDKKRREEMEKKKRAVQLKAEELKIIRDELAKHVEALKRRIAEVEQARLKKLKDRQNAEMQTNHTKLMNTLKILKRYVKKRAKCIRNETGFDFEKDKNNLLIHRKFAGDKKEEQNLWELKKKREMGDEDKFKLPQNLKDQIDDEVENRGFQKLSKAQEDNRLQVSNFNDEERRKLEERLRREGKLSENEIENILNDYDMHTRDMAIMLQEDEHRQQENFKRQLEARKKRRKTIFDEIEQLKEERKKQKAKDAQDMKEEQDAMSRQLIDEEKELRKKMEKDLEDKKNASLAEFKNKLKKNKDKDNFKELLEEYSRKEKEVEKDLYNERNRALANIQAKLNERKRALARKLEIEKEDPLAEKIESKISLLKKEAEDEAAEILEEERRKKKIQAQLSLMRKENDEFINHLRDVNQEKYEDFCNELDQKYDENKLGKLIDVKSGSESLQSMREELADLFSLVKRTKNPEEIAKYQQRIEELKKLIANADKDGKLEENIKKNNKLLQERAKLIEERESKKKEFKWKQFEDEEKERDALLEKERQEWLKKEKEAIDAVVNKFFDKEDPEGLAEVLDQVYGAGSKLYSDRLFDQNNKLQEKKARRLKYNFNSNLDNKIHDIEELSKVMNPQLEKLNAKKYLIPEDDYKSQLKDLMMKENEKRAEIEAMAASREQDSQSKTMLNFVDLQKNMIDHLNEDMKELREYAFKPDKFKDKQLKNEVKKLNQKYDKELEKMKKDEEESKKKQIDDINNRFKKGRDELEKNRRDFEMLGLFEKRLDDNKTNEEKFKMQNKKLMLDQLSKEKDKLGKELTDDEKAILMENYERKMKNLNKALEREFNRQNKDHSKQLADKIRELEMKKRERELLMNSLSMYKDARAEQIAYEDNFEKLASIIEEDLELIDHEAYSYKPMKIYDLIKWKRETDDFLDALGGDATLLERVRRIEKYVGNLDTSSYNRIKKLIEKIKKRG